MLKKKNYCISRENIAQHEWIGLHATVSESPDRSRIGVRGRIVNETKNLVVIETKRGEKKLPKREIKLTVRIGNEDVLLDCSKLRYRPEDRVKSGGNAHA